MGFFKTADEELDVEESNIESRLREFILEDPDEFVDPDSEEETALTGDKRKLYAGVHVCCTGLADTELTGTVRARKDRENVLDGCPLGNGGLTCGGRSCNVISSLATVTLRCSTLHPTQVARPRLPRHSNKAYRHRSPGGNDGRRLRRRTLMLPTIRFLGSSTRTSLRCDTSESHTQNFLASRRAKKLRMRRVTLHYLALLPPLVDRQNLLISPEVRF